jgi:hypothetical protein
LTSRDRNLAISALRGSILGICEGLSGGFLSVASSIPSAVSAFEGRCGGALCLVLLRWRIKQEMPFFACPAAASIRRLCWSDRTCIGLPRVLEFSSFFRRCHCSSFPSLLGRFGSLCWCCKFLRANTFFVVGRGSGLHLPAWVWGPHNSVLGGRIQTPVRW